MYQFFFPSSLSLSSFYFLPSWKETRILKWRIFVSEKKGEKEKREKYWKRKREKKRERKTKRERKKVDERRKIPQKWKWDGEEDQEWCVSGEVIWIGFVTSHSSLSFSLTFFSLSPHTLSLSLTFFLPLTFSSLFPLQTFSPVEFLSVSFFHSSSSREFFSYLLLPSLPLFFPCLSLSRGEQSIKKKREGDINRKRENWKKKLDRKVTILCHE